jgi:hypothetical protein
VYTGMRRASVLTITVLLAIPAFAQAKGAIVTWDRYPEQVKVGESTGFTLMVPPMRGMRPLVTFRSQSGRIVRVRTTRADLNGIAYGSVAFPDKGPWGTEVHAGTLRVGTPDSIPFRVGVGLTRTISFGNDPAPRDAGGGFPWPWVLAFGAIGSAALVFTLRRHGHWGAA